LNKTTKNTPKEQILHNLEVLGGAKNTKDQITSIQCKSYLVSLFIQLKHLMTPPTVSNSISYDNESTLSSQKKMLHHFM